MSLNGPIAPGTKLCVDYSSTFTDLGCVTVIRTTRTQVITTHHIKDEQRWRRSDGRMVGAPYYDSPTLKPWTDELRAKRRRQRAIRDMSQQLHRFDGLERAKRRHLDVEQLELAAAHLCQALEKAEGAT